MFNYKHITFFIVLCLVNELLKSVNGIETDRNKYIENDNVFQPNTEWNTLKNVRKAVAPVIRLFSSGNIVVGAGYSSDSQQMAPQICYNATISSTSEPQGFMQLDTAISFTRLENILGVSVGLGGLFEMFAAGAELDYIRSVEDKDYSLSLNYLQYSVSNVAVQLGGYGEDALTDLGKAFYKDGKNPYFGLICGDNYISSYQKGALLIMGLNIKFVSSIVKNEFIQTAGVTFGNIISATESIKTVASKYKIIGSIIIQAFQIGGDPSRLSKVLEKDTSGKYYILTCSLTAIDNCVKAASGLLDYAKNDFSTQISLPQKPDVFTPLGVAFSQFIPIEHIGLTPPVSLVTLEVRQYRDELSNKLKENEYYLEKIYPFLNQGYPVELDITFMKNINLLLSKANSNINLLMQDHNGAADCFNLPDKCKIIKSRIDSQLQTITKDDLKFLKDIKYTITTLGGLFYNIGQDLATSWRGVTHESGGYILAKVQNVSVTFSEYSYHIFVHKSGYNPSSLYEYNFHGSSLDEITYSGSLCYYPQTCRPLTETKQLSPYYFETYSSKIADRIAVNLVH
ncbi:hypothetical protein O3M35_012444 [Rhynocoris fuscipes]|uniref:Uncharacterized protein n=1 Tax=Rhynocoris fuscipes TaxID=488301 RepID=A0AAW1CVJ5_9HEMI